MLAPYRSRLLASTLLVGAAVASPAFAQTADPASQPKTGIQSNDLSAPAAGISSQESAPPAAETTTGDVVVTGTLIRNPNLVASSPVAVVGQEELALRQTNTAEQVLRDLPGAVASIGSAVNNGNNGASFADLRGLGNFRNIVLLDGVRITPTSAAGRVDLNNIPLALIERVDTLTGGAATTYGADAVSGVINFITRSDFSGIEAQVSNQITERGDGHTFRADVTVGANLEDGRGNVVLSLGYQQADPVYQDARVFSRNNYTSTSGNRGGSATTAPTRFGIRSLTSQTAANSIYNPATGQLQPYVGSQNGFNFNPYNVFQVPFERFNIYGAANYEVADGIEVYTRGMFTKSTTNTIVAPSGAFNQNLTIPLSNPFLPAAVRAQFCQFGDFDLSTGGQQGLSAAQCAAAAAATSASDPNFRALNVLVGRRSVELGPRISDFTTQFFDYRAGVKLDVTDSIGLDVSGSYGESQNQQTQDGYVLISRLRTAVYTTSATSCNLGSAPAVPNPTNPLLPPLASAGAGTQGCVPVNLFGNGLAIDPASIPYLTASATSGQKASLAQVRALLSGDFGATLPWASEPIGFAIGGEYRKQTASQYADSLAQTAGELGGAGGAVSIFQGGYDVKEAYGEIIAPIVADVPFFQSLTLEGGLRYSDYTVDAPGNPSFSTTTYKLGGSWEPVDGIKVRGNYQRAVRAPNIDELFAPRNTGLTNLSQDPCAGAAPTTNAALQAVCLFQGAPASTIGAILNPTAAQANATTQGGTYLRPEKSDSYTIGVVLQPSFVPGLSITVDYYNIKIKRAITQPTVGDLVSGCFDNPSVTNPICALFIRNPVTGGLDGDPSTTPGILFPASNNGYVLTDGIDLGVNYRRDLGFAKLNLSFQGNWTNRSQFQALAPGSTIPPGYPGAGGAFPVSDISECIGLYGVNCGSPASAGPTPGSTPGSLQPEFSWQQRTTLTFGDVDFSLLWRHIDNMRVEPGFNAFSGTISSGALAGRTYDFGRIKAYDYFDLSTRVGVSDNFDFTFTVMNLLDKQPPVVGGTIGSTSFNSGNTYPSTYDALGRRYAIAARLKF